MRHETFPAPAQAEPAPADNPAMLGHLPDGTGLLLDMWMLSAPHTFIQGGTGSGKTSTACAWTELARDQRLPVTVLDPEGQFGPLRESCPGVIVIGGADGDLPLDIDTIGAAAAEAFRNRSSFVVRLDELRLSDQRKVVAEVLRVLMEMPQEYWAKRLVVIDEVHLFAPQRGSSEAAGPLAEVAGRGRRRGYCLVLATQRFARVDKDAITQCLNLLIGKNKLGSDLGPAAEALGLTPREAQRLQVLPRGTFLATGPDFGDELAELKIAKPRTVLAGAVDEESARSEPDLSHEDQIAALRRVGGTASGVSSPVFEPRLGQRAHDAGEGALKAPTVETATTPHAQLGMQILTILAAARINSVPLPAVVLLLRTSLSASMVVEAIAELRRRRFIVGRKRLTLTAAGRKSPESGQVQARALVELLGALRRQLHPDAQRILDALSAAAQPLGVEEIARRTGWPARSRKLQHHLALLSRRRLVRKQRDG